MEACLNARWIEKDLTDEKAQKFTKDVLNYMRENYLTTKKNTVIYIIWKQLLPNQQLIVLLKG